jgi:hypothetical protein
MRAYLLTRNKVCIGSVQWHKFVGSHESSVSAEVWISFIQVINRPFKRDITPWRKSKKKKFSTRLFFMLLETTNEALWVNFSSSVSAFYAMCNRNPFSNFVEGI